MNIIFSIIAVSYNHKCWFEKLFESFKSQTVFEKCELIVVDNDSKDGTDKVCMDEFKSWNGHGVFVRSGGNIGFGSAHNLGAKVARGKYLFFLSPDVWFETDCMERFLEAINGNDAKVFSALELKYNSNEPQSGSHGYGSPGFDVFGCTTSFKDGCDLNDMFAIGSFYFMEKELFFKIGGFDERFFVYGEEMDMSWRARISGEKIKTVEKARIHHAACGCTDSRGQLNEFRRFYANRNQLMLILKNSSSILSVMALTHILLIAAESFTGALLARRPSFIWWSLIKPVAACFQLRGHIFEQRRRIKRYRQVGDFEIARRYFRLGFGHWNDVKRFFSFKISFKPYNSTYTVEQTT